jgi:peptidyl-prolyl cis-trans isomerase B (cyclophilin B)
MTNKRDRELARAKYERQQERRSQRQTRDRLTKLAISAGVILVVVIGIAVSKNVSKDSAATPNASTPSATNASTTSLPICQEVGPNRPDTLKITKVSPKAQAGSALTLKTNCGKIDIALDKRAPMTATVMSYLASRGFFNQTQCHRLTTAGIYVLQCGDPTATGSGGPDFSFADENLPETTSATVVYKRGTVAMANSGPNTNGSQFFLVYKDSPLPPKYTVWGEITSGLDILDQVAGAGVAGGGADGSPNQRVVITKASVTP